MDNLNILMEKLEKRDKDTERVFFDYKDLTFSGGQGKLLQIGSEQYGLHDESFTALCRVLDVPKPFASRCDKDLQDQIFNNLIQKRSGTMFSMLAEENRVRSFLSPDYPYVSTFKVVETELNEYDGELEVGNYHLDDNVLEFVGFTPAFDQTIIDSPVRGGLRVVHSDAWTVFPRFDAYLYRVLCTNGLISPLEHRKFRVSGKSESEVLDQVREFVSIALQQIPAMFEGFLALEDLKVENFVSFIRKICLENKLPKKIREILIETSATPEFKSTVRGGIKTMYDVVNLLTYVASHNDSLSEAHREHLHSIAGSLTLTQSARCNSCGGAVE